MGNLCDNHRPSASDSTMINSFGLSSMKISQTLRTRRTDEPQNLCEFAKPSRGLFKSFQRKNTHLKPSLTLIDSIKIPIEPARGLAPALFFACSPDSRLKKHVRIAHRLFIGGILLNIPYPNFSHDEVCPTRAAYVI